MVVLFVVLTFATFIGIDYVLNREKYLVKEEDLTLAPVHAVAPRPFEPVYINGVMMLPSLKYHAGHSWASVEGTATARVGLDDFASKLLSKVAKIDFPAVGRWIRQGEKAFSIQQDGRTVNIISPVEGEVIEINPNLLTNPDQLRDDPYGQGWVMVVHSPDLQTTLRNLLSGTLALRWMEDSIERLRLLFAPALPALSQEAGPLKSGFTADLDESQFAKFTREFLLN